MAIFIVFVCITLLSLAIQWLSKRWQIATAVPCIIFIALLGFGGLFPQHSLLALTLGFPMVFFAALLGCYIYETRINPERHKLFEEGSDNEKVEDESTSDKN